MQQLKSYIWHGLCWVCILGLGLYLYRSEQDNFQNELIYAIQKDLEVTADALALEHNRIYNETNRLWTAYPSASAQSNKVLLNRFIIQYCSIFQWINALDYYDKEPFYPALERAYQNFVDNIKDNNLLLRHENRSLAQFQTSIYKDLGGKIWLSREENKRLLLSYAKFAVLQNLIIVDKEIHAKHDGDENFWDPFSAEISFDNLNFWDNNVTKGDVFFHRYGQFWNNKNTRCRYFLNDREFPAKEDCVHFEHKFDTPGVHPLKARIQLEQIGTDSVSVSEKIYYVKVDR